MMHRKSINLYHLLNSQIFWKRLALKKGFRPIAICQIDIWPIVIALILFHKSQKDAYGVTPLVASLAKLSKILEMIGTEEKFLVYCHLSDWLLTNCHSTIKIHRRSHHLLLHLPDCQIFWQWLALKKSFRSIAISPIDVWPIVIESKTYIGGHNAYCFTCQIVKYFGNSWHWRKVLGLLPFVRLTFDQLS